MTFFVLLAALALWAAWRTVVLVRTDGLGNRPAPRSHAAQTMGRTDSATWPQHEADTR